MTSDRPRVEDAEGESSACSDNECGCHQAARDLRDELDEASAYEAEAPGVAGGLRGF